MIDHIDTNKAQLSALGEHQPLCLATENEALKRQVAVMAELLREAIPYVEREVAIAPSKQIAGYHETLVSHMKESIAGKLPEPAPVVSAVLKLVEGVQS